MPSLTPEMFAAVLPLAVKWVEDGQRFIFEHGRSLSAAEKNDARLAGVRYPEQIRLLYVPHIPLPDDRVLKNTNDIVQLVTPQTAGLTLRYGIFVRRDCQGDRRLLVHEFVHASQYERLGSAECFLRQYLDECIRFGYLAAPMEQEAVLTAQRICC